MSIIKWMTAYGFAEIVRQECIRENATSVWFMERPFIIGEDKPQEREVKAAKIGNCRYHDTWADAHEFLIISASEKAHEARRQWESSVARLKKIENMEPP